jgi:tRNA (guanine37-N1)-methyltransferase
MHLAVVTLFPELFEAFFRTSFVGKAVESGALVVHLEDLRQHGLGKHRSVDDTPYGGGSGMVMRPDATVAAIEAAQAALPEPAGIARRMLLTPQGARFNQARARDLSALPALMLVCGRYEGFDERVRHFVDEELSIGDFVLTGGETAAMCVIEATIRLIEGVLGNEDSTREESFSPDCGGLLEYPHYTRPVSFRGYDVPEVLRGGDHARIAAWRREQSRARTELRRPDLAPSQKKARE